LHAIAQHRRPPDQRAILTFAYRPADIPAVGMVQGLQAGGLALETSAIEFT
jgi:hypothetical protein